MTGHQINSLVGDLVAMAQAMEELPKVKHELAIREDDYNQLLNRIKLVQEDLDQAKSYAASLEQKVRDAEVAKDQAETMFLEADERTSRALDFIKATFGNAGSLIQALEPPKPETVSIPLELHPAIFDNPVHEAHFEAGVQGQSEPDPTSANAATKVEESLAMQPTQEEIATTSATSWAGPASTDTPLDPAPPYMNQRYIDVQGWISRENWLAGGGTNESYDFRYDTNRI